MREFAVAGFTFEGRDDIIDDLRIGQGVMLIREPTCQYDPNAIRIDTQLY